MSGGCSRHHVDIGPLGPIPGVVVALFESIPEDVEQPSRQSKRARTNSPEIERIALGQSTMRISRPFNEHLYSFENAISRQNIVPFLSLELKSTGTPDQKMEISGLNADGRLVVASIDVSDLVIDTCTETALRIIQQQPKAHKKSQRFIWVKIGLSLTISGSHMFLDFIFVVHWNNPIDSIRCPPKSSLAICRAALEAIYPRDQSITVMDCGDDRNSQHWGSPRRFYDAAFVPPQLKIPRETRVVRRLAPALHPFQVRTLHWLLLREGVIWKGVLPDGTPELKLVEEDGESRLPISFFKSQDATGRAVYVSHLYPAVVTDASLLRDAEVKFRGGILAEEMGLGKTVELMALIALHRCCPETKIVYDEHSGAMLRSTSATLVVTPPSLKDQWINELTKHAPKMNIMVYPGMKSLTTEAQVQELVEEMAQCDVVVATYSHLTAEVHYAEPPPDRPRRFERKYSRKESALMQIMWWRLCLDEAQMVESGVTGAAQVAQLLPRVNSWAVTGTPVKDDVDDLFGLLLFLRYQPFAGNKQAWRALNLEKNQGAFRSLFNQIALRHTKSMVRNELGIPPQDRFVVAMPFNAVEEQNYQGLFDSLMERCGLDPDGNPSSESWDPNSPAVVEAMRSSLDKLRQTALHPEVGYAKVVGNSKAVPMRTRADVLNQMLEDSDALIHSKNRSILGMALTRGQILQGSGHITEARDIWERLRDDSRALVEQSRPKVPHKDRPPASSGERSTIPDDDEDIDEGGDGKETRKRLRYYLEILHHSVFFCGNAYFQIKSDPKMTDPESEEFKVLSKLEDEHYREARQIRKEILRASYSKAQIWMESMSRSARNQSFVEIPSLGATADAGIETRGILDSLELCQGGINDNANFVDELRENLVQLILTPLVDQDEDDTEMTGEEFSESKEIQDKMEAYLTVLRAAVSDRERAITGHGDSFERLILVDRKKAELGKGPAPEKLLELVNMAMHSGLVPPHYGSLAAVTAQLKTKIGNLRANAALGNDRARAELALAEILLKKVSAEASQQRKLFPALATELRSFTQAVNSRIAFYAQFQSISDSVSDLDTEKERRTAEQVLEAEEAAKKKLRAMKSHHRFLLHMKATDAGADQVRSCRICCDAIEIGVLTVCGHEYCKGCLMLWYKAHRKCPLCNRPLRLEDLHDISYKPQELKMWAEAPERRPPGSSREVRKARSAIYRSFDEEKLAEIENTDLDGPSFTTKVDTLVRHLFWLRDQDPGCKSIVFSQYSAFLLVLAEAFTTYRIGFTSMDPKVGGANGVKRFKEDAGIEVFLLHARAHSSGLNLVNASHVFLCEPLLNTALELQAIARVDRIGQQHNTTVWLYLVEGTVEESIYELSLKRRMAHLARRSSSDAKYKGKEKVKDGDEAVSSSGDTTPNEEVEAVDEEGLTEANTLEMEGARLSRLMQKGPHTGERVENEDLWQCLFGHVAGRRRRHEEAMSRVETRMQDPVFRRFFAAQAAEARRDGCGGAS